MRTFLSRKTASYIKGLGLYQIAGGAIGFSLILWSAVNSSLLQNLKGGSLTLTLMFLPFTYSVLCGILCLRLDPRALQYSLVNQFLQVVGVAAYGFAFSYASGLYLSCTFDLSESFELHFGGGICRLIVNISNEPEQLWVSLNLLAIFLIYFIDRLKKKVLAEKQLKKMTDLGS